MVDVEICSHCQVTQLLSETNNSICHFLTGGKQGKVTSDRATVNTRGFTLYFQTKLCAVSVEKQNTNIKEIINHKVSKVLATIKDSKTA